MRRMPVLQALAYGFATPSRSASLRAVSPGRRCGRPRRRSRRITATTRRGGLRFRRIVFINVPAEERTRVLDQVLTKVATDEPHPPLEEDFLVELREGRPPCASTAWSCRRSSRPSPTW
jgi:hypothetical protein